MLTVIIVPTDKDGIAQTIESFKGIHCTIEILGKDRNFNVPVHSIWKIFMYEGERLSEEVREALPYFLEDGRTDIYQLYSRFYRNGINFNLSPRLFKANVEIKEDSILPKKLDLWKIDTVLNGFIDDPSICSI